MVKVGIERDISSGGGRGFSNEGSSSGESGVSDGSSGGSSRNSSGVPKGGMGGLNPPTFQKVGPQDSHKM